MKKWKRKGKNYIKGLLLGFLILLVFACWQNLQASGEAPALKELIRHLQGNLCVYIMDMSMPVITASGEERTEKRSPENFILAQLMKMMPIQSYAMDRKEYNTEVESELTYEMLMAREGVDEQYKDGELVDTAEEPENAATQEDLAIIEEVAQAIQGTFQAGDSFETVTEPMVKISREKLNDFDYLIQNFYTVDKTTTINGSQLNAAELLARDLKLTGSADAPQILIHHTHSQERYADSSGDVSDSIVGVGEYLTELLRAKGFNVIHDTGIYDVPDHQNAYSYAGAATEKILAENPSIEVIIDLHRDGIKEGHLVTEVNGKQTAQIMFFNGLSRTTSKGDLTYISNPYIQDNLALSLQMKLAAEEYYPGFTRPNYLKGYRYNLHYLPRSMLVEVGAQTNTVKEAMNAMEPLADLLYKVLMP